MSGKKTVMLCLASFALIGLWSAPALATWIDTVTPYDDGTTVWKGETTFSVVLPSPALPLSGHIDWAVFAPWQPLPFSDYTRTPGQFTYVYQVYNDVTAAALSYYGVILENQAGNIDWSTDAMFGVPAVEPYSASITPPPDGAAEWDFSNLAAGSVSSGLVFSSPQTPMDFYSIVINSGEYAIAEPVPSPSPNSIPEPATIWLLVSGLGTVLGAYWWRRR